MYPYICCWWIKRILRSYSIQSACQILLRGSVFKKNFIPSLDRRNRAYPLSARIPFSSSTASVYWRMSASTSSSSAIEITTAKIVAMSTNADEESGKKQQVKSSLVLNLECNAWEPDYCYPTSSSVTAWFYLFHDSKARRYTRVWWVSKKQECGERIVLVWGWS